MFSYSTGYYVSPPDDQYLKFKNRCSLTTTHLPFLATRLPHLAMYTSPYLATHLPF